VRIVLISLLVIQSGPAFPQSVAARPEFEVVDIKPNNSPRQIDDLGTILPSGQFRAINIPVRELIKFAFKVRAEAIVGPDWIDTARYDVIGKSSPVGVEEVFWRSTSIVQIMTFSYQWDDVFRKMVQTFLMDRFKMAVHQENRPMDVYALVVDKGGPKLQPPAEPGRPDCTRRVGAELRAEGVCKNVTMANLAEALQVMAPGYANRQVIDMTGISGAWDLKLEWVGIQNIDSGGLTMPGALQKQLGLKMEPRKLPVPTIVIDHIEQPSEN
jgi:uncharacterized protein (TIGR03435 family)